MFRILIIIILHAFADFFVQGRKVRKFKIFKLPVLLEHVGIYTFIFVIFSPLLLGLKPLQGLVFSLLNGALHLLIDFITGKLKEKYQYKNEYKFLLTISVDHTLHLIILIFTYMYFFPGAINSFYGLTFN